MNITILSTAALIAAIALSPLTPAAASPQTEIHVAQAGAACGRPDVPAGTVYAAPAERPESPGFAYDGSATGTSYVQVDIDASGRLTNESILKSSGNPLLDREALATTRRSTFRPEIRACVPISGTYVFIVDYPQ